MDSLFTVDCVLVLALPQLDDSRHRVALHLPMQTDVGVRPVATTARHATALLRAATNTAASWKGCDPFLFRRQDG